MTPHRTPGSGPPFISRATMPRGVFGVLDQVQHPPGSVTAAGCPKSRTSAARRKIIPGSRRSAWR